MIFGRILGRVIGLLNVREGGLEQKGLIIPSLTAKLGSRMRLVQGYRVLMSLWHSQLKG